MDEFALIETLLTFEKISGRSTFSYFVRVLISITSIAISIIIFAKSDIIWVCKITYYFLTKRLCRSVAHCLSKELIQLVRFLIFLVQFIKIVSLCKAIGIFRIHCLTKTSHFIRYLSQVLIAVRRVIVGLRLILLGG